MIARASKTVRIVESFSPGTRLDKRAGIVRGVKILGSQSKHGYTYTKECCRSAVPLYEGVRVNIDHIIDPKKRAEGRSYRDRFGVLKNVKFKESNGKYAVFGDLHYNRGHVLARQFEWDVLHSPESAGLSHDANGTRVRRGKEVLVESLSSVISVDVVADAATTSSLFESYNPKKRNETMGLRAKRKDSQRSSGTGVLKTLSKKFGIDVKDLDVETLQESIGVGQDDITPGQAILQSVVAVVGDDSKRPGERVKTLRSLLESLAPTAPKKSVPAPKKKTVSREESVIEGTSLSKLEARLDQLERENQILRLCEGFTPSAVQMKALLACESDDEIEELLEAFGPDDDEDDDDDVEERAPVGRAHSKLGPSGAPKAKSASRTTTPELTRDKFFESVGIRVKKEAV